MSEKIGIVDLFSGPGGLGEGFSAFRGKSGKALFSIEVSIEMERSAHATLTLRSFLRKFGDNLPQEYYDFLHGESDEPDWATLYPDEWKAAENECHCMELGKPETSAFLKRRIREIRKQYGDNTVLIGGPPCQAYSLVGRARNVGKRDYLPHRDERNFLYEKYVEVLTQLRPAVFVMENVKGMLSSAVKGDGIFKKVMADLRSAGGRNGYRLYALSPKYGGLFSDEELEPRDFIVCAEKHGVPQARHRVIIVGVREDAAGKLDLDQSHHLTESRKEVSVRHILSAMPQLRSGLSRDDGPEAWREAVERAVQKVRRSKPQLETHQMKGFASALDACLSKLEFGHTLSRTKADKLGLSNRCPHHLRDWIVDRRLKRLPNCETRGHMPSDLARYLFASCFAVASGRTPKASDYPDSLAPNHRNWKSGKFKDRFRVQVWDKPSSTITSHISKDGHYFIHPDPSQCRSLTVREAARLQTFPDNYYFKGTRTEQYVQVGNAVPPYLAFQIARVVWGLFQCSGNMNSAVREKE